MNWYLHVLKKYAVFSGRARRKEYWYFILFGSILLFVLTLIEGLVGIASGVDFSVFGILYSLAVLLPSVAVAVRRLHDTGRSGWWYFLHLVPIIGSFILFFLFTSDSQKGTNQYGPSPKLTEE